MVKERVRDGTIADKEERKRRKKALKKTTTRQSNGEDAEDAIETDAGDKLATSKTEVNNSKAKKTKKVKRRMSETEGEEEKESLPAEVTNGSSEIGRAHV